jgi:hypothetical protein
MSAAIPTTIRLFLINRIHESWNGMDAGSGPVIAGLPASMPTQKVLRLVAGGPFGWMLDARLDNEEGGWALEVLEDDRMRGPMHYRVWDDGRVEELETQQIGYVWPKDTAPEDQERIRAEYFAHNRRVSEQLQARGFWSNHRDE